MNRSEGGELHAVGNHRPVKEQEQHDDEEGNAEKSPHLRFRRRIKSLGKSGPVILGHQPAPSRHHGLGGLRASWTVGITVTAIIAEPGFRRFQQLISQAELEIAINFSRKGVVPGRQRTGGGTVATLHAGFHIPGPKPLDLAVQIRADIIFLHNLPLESPASWANRKSLSNCP